MMSEHQRACFDCRLSKICTVREKTLELWRASGAPYRGTGIFEPELSRLVARNCEFYEPEEEIK